MFRLILSFVALFGTALSAQSLDQSARLMSERLKLTSEFARLSGDLRASKSPAAIEAVSQKLADFSSRTDTFRKDIASSNFRVLDRLSPYANSATIKAAYEKLRNADMALSSMPLPAGPSFSPQDLNKIQQVLDRAKTAIELHKHAAANIR